MKVFASLDEKDRKLLSACLATVVAMAVLAGIFAKDQNRDDNPLPSSYLTGRHGTRAAFELLEQSGYKVERWEQPLTDLATTANAQTVVIFAEPVLTREDDFKAVQEILKRGGRVLVTGPTGGQLAPEGSVEPSLKAEMGPCKLTPQGLDPLANSGEVWMVPAASWHLTSPSYRVQYTCARQPAVVEYAVGPGHVVWWASSTPLENGSIARAGDLNLFLNALGGREGRHFYWDESLHGETRSEWFYARGPAMNLLLIGLGILGLLTVFSFSRRRGPVREVPQPARTSPIEFLGALGSLYAKAGASATAVDLAYERFRRTVAGWCGIEGVSMNSHELSQALRRRFPAAREEMEADLAACEESATNDALTPREALALVQKLYRHREELADAARARLKKS